MKTIQMQVGNLGTNCYIVYSKASLDATVIDPGGHAEDIIALINREKLNVVCIINTHGHADHISANDKLQQATGAPILIHADDAHMLTSAKHNLSMYIGGSIQFKPADRLLKDGDEIRVGEINFKVLHTPGHTPGGICLLTDGILFSGDTLFYESVGRSDFPGGSYSNLITSIKQKLMELEDSTKVLPGHGPETTIGWERKMNPFIQ